MPDKLEVTCCDCPATRRTSAAKAGGAKTPKGWRKIAEGKFRCGVCQAKQFVGRSIRLAIRDVHASDGRDRAGMYVALNAASKQSNQFANWLLQQLLAADLAQVAQCRGVKKFPAAPQVEYYRAATELFPALAPTSIVQQAQMVQRYYAKERFACLAAMAKNVRSYRWDGLPVVVNAQSWRLVAIENEIVLKAQIGPGKSWTLRVFAEGENLLRMRQIAAGDVIPGAAMFVRRARAPRPGETKRVRVWYLRISAQVPRAQKRRGKGTKELTLTLGHDAQVLLYGALDEGDEVFEYPAIALRSLIAAHKKLDRQRQVDNSFRYAHWSKRKAKRWAQDRTAACERNRRKVTAEIALAAAGLARWCESHAVTAVDYDVTPRGWMESFPYYALAQRIQTSLENAGIAVHQLGAPDKSPQISIEEPTESQPAFAGPKCETEEVA